MSRVLPILFNTEMVWAILDGRKTVTRRIVKLPKYIEQQKDGLYTLFAEGTCYENQSMEEITDYLKPPYKPGDILYIRETWNHVPCIDCNMGQSFHIQCKENPVDYDDGNSITEGCFIYKASYPETRRIRWRPSIHMPKQAARIWLKVTDVRVERLQEITLYDAHKEGASEPCIGMSACGGGCEQCPADWNNSIRVFQKIWDSTIKKTELGRYGWEANPWVWVIEFEGREKPE